MGAQRVRARWRRPEGLSPRARKPVPPSQTNEVSWHERAKDSRPLATARRAVAACPQACAAQPNERSELAWAVQDSNL